MALTKVTGDFIKAGVITQAHLHSSHGITSTHIAEGDKLFFTNARARGAISVSGNALSYNSSTGVITSNFEESPTFTGNVSVSGTTFLDGDVTIGDTSSAFIGMARAGANYLAATNSSGELVFRTAGSNVALTLDTNQNAIFASAVWMPDYLYHHGDSDTSMGFPTNNEWKVTVGGSTKIFADSNKAYLYYQGGLKFQTTSGGIEVTGDADVSGEVQVGGQGSNFSENNLRFKSSGAAYIDHNTVGQSFIFRTSASSSLDTTALTIASNANATFAGNVTASSGTGHFSVVNSSGYQLNGTYVMDSSRNLVNIANITASGAAGDGTPLLTLTGSASATFNWISKSLHANLTAGETNIHLFGKAASTKNSGYIGYTWAGDGSNNNYVGIGHYAANHLFRVYGDQVLSTITLRSDVDVHSPIYYDKNNTSYYLHPDSSSNLLALVVQDNLFMNAGQLYIGAANGTTDDSYRMYESSGEFIWQSRESGTWTTRFSISNGGAIYSHVDHRAPVFYDSNDTTYYIDAGSTSTSGKFRQYVNIGDSSSYSSNSGTWGARLNVVDNVHARIDVGQDANSMLSTWYAHTGQSGPLFGSMTAHPLRLMYNGSEVGKWDSAQLHHNSSVRGPIFYDSNNTAYYVDPASTTVLNGLTVGGNTVSGFSGSWNGSNFPGSRFGGYSVNGGEIVFQRDNPSSGKMSVMVDGNFYAGENGGFWSIWSGNNYNNKVGIYGDSSGNLNIGTSASENVLRTNHGYIQMGPMNSSHAHIYTDRANFYLNKPLYVLGSSLINQNDIRTQILYDANDTSYYFEGNGTSRFHSIWCRGAAVNSAPRWDTSFHVAQSQHFYGHSSTQTIYHGEAGNTYQFPGNGGVRSQIFYDYNNTGYYLHGDNISNLHSIDFDGVLSGGGRAVIGRNHAYDTMELKGYGAELMIGGQSGALHINYRTCNNGASGHTPTTWYWRAGASNNYSDHYFGLVQSSASVRGPIFYDSNDTNYYGDFASTGVFNNFQLKGTINLPASGLATHGSSHRPAYGIYQEGGSWSHPFPDLCIAMHTGIKLGANASYNGIRFYNDYTMATQVMAINDSSSPAGAGQVYVNDTFLAGGSVRGPIFYDSNNTSYYTRPSTYSYMNQIWTAGTIQAGSSGTGNIYLGNNGVSGSGNHFRFHTNNSHTYFDGNCGDIHWRQGSSTRFIFYMTTANMTVNGTVTQNSDERIKENIITIDSALNKVNQLRGVYYNRTDINTSQKQIGLIAQEVENVIPEVVLTANDELGTKSISYGQINALLIEAIKEQQTIIDDLKSRIETLENQ